MRLIVRNRPSLHVWNVSDYIKQTQANIARQDGSRYITLQHIFRKLYLAHLAQHQRNHAHQRALNNLVLLAPAPAQAVANYFHMKAKDYSEPFLRSAFEAVARAHQLSKADHSGSLDTLGYKLFYSAEFCNLSEELKYALRNNKIEFATLASVLDSLVKLEYVDHEVVSLLLLYTRREIEGKSPYALLDEWEGDREFQIEKQGYYNPRELDDLAALRSSEEVRTALSFVRHIYREWEERQAVLGTLARHDIRQLNALVEELAQTSRNFRKLVEGVISVRRQYSQMADFSQHEGLLRNPNLNLELLELEEKLIATRLITIEDVKNPKGIADTEAEIARIEQILLRVLDVRRIDPIFAFVDKSPIEVANEKEEHRPDAAKIAVLLSGLAKLAEIDRHVYHAKDGKNLVSLKWEKTLVAQQEGRQLRPALQEELNVSRIYRRVYKEVFQFIDSQQARLEAIFKGAVLPHKAALLDAYCRIGLSEHAIHHLAAVDKEQLPQTLADLTASQFESLLAALNNVGIFVSKEGFHAAVFAQLATELEKEEQNMATHGLRYSIDAANYLLQNHRAQPHFRPVYERQLRLLEAKATYVTVEEKENESIVEAFKILALEKPEKFGSHPIYLNYLHRAAHDDYKRNPFLAIVREAAFKWAGREGALRQLQDYLTVGVSGGVKNAVIFSNSEQTSLDGEIRSGDHNSYILRVELRHAVKLNEVAVNSLLDVDYRGHRAFRLKPLAELRARLEAIFELQQQEFDLIYQQLHANILEVFRFFKPSIVSDRIRFKLMVLDRLRAGSCSVETKEQEYANKAKFLLEVLELNKLVSLLSDKDICATVAVAEQPNAPLNEGLQAEKQQQAGEVVEVDVDTVRMQLKEIKGAVPELLDSLAKFIGQETQSMEKALTQAHLGGQRQSIEVLEGEASEAVDLTYELLDLRYYKDKTYCEYKDWRQRIGQRYQCAELDYQGASNLTKILANKLCGDASNRINLLPLVRHEDRIQRLPLDLKLLAAPPAAAPAALRPDREVDYIITLQNFKHELKAYYSPRALVDYIFGFKFVGDLHKRSPEKEALVLQRDPEEHFNYLEQLSERTYLDSPYAQYILGKLGRTDRIRQLLEDRKALRASLRVLYQKGLLDGKEYFARVSDFEDRIIGALEELKGKMLDHTEDGLLRGELKMLDVRRQELAAFEELLGRQFGYSRHFDEDFLQAQGDYARALHLKRGRAQSNYVRLYLLKKLGDNQLLDNRERELLQRWHEDIARGVSEFVVYGEYTTLQICDLVWEDIQRLKLRDTHLTVNKEMLLIDLILELNMFLDDSLLLAYEREAKAELIRARYNVPSYLFDKTSGAGFKRLEAETEAALADEHSQLQPQELDKVEELFKVYKTQGFRERSRYGVLCRDFRANIAEMNGQVIRNELIEEYVKHLEGEFYKEYDPALVADVKERETDKLWRSVFQATSYEGCGKDVLRETTKKLILRLEVIGTNPPPFFGHMLLKLLLHPNIDAHSREVTIPPRRASSQPSSSTASTSASTPPTSQPSPACPARRCGPPARPGRT